MLLPWEAHSRRHANEINSRHYFQSRIEGEKRYRLPAMSAAAAAAAPTKSVGLSVRGRRAEQGMIKTQVTTKVPESPLVPKS